MNGFWKAIGSVVRSTGQALDSVGAGIQGRLAVTEKLNRTSRLASIGSNTPQVADDVFVAPNASVLGNVKLARGATVWPGSIIRGDVNAVSVDEHAVISENTIITALPSATSTPVSNTVIGKRAVIDAGAILSACTVGEDAYIGAGAILESGVVVEKAAHVAAGAIVPAGTTVPSGQVWEGNPAKYVGDVTAHHHATHTKAIKDAFDVAADYEVDIAMTAEDRDKLKWAAIFGRSEAKADYQY
eukprot:TRINITY_DN1850_c0_g1_i1.p1 TRINITY_DN1850_c0_g1~~TRINITY_DN1850_c0_g1_i1.p1  ORF type:complete len:243 (-),score=57.80 TRINITY_DN1850_c0_g1_i1:352-1080(-)